MASFVASNVPSLSAAPVSVTVCPTCPSSFTDFDITGHVFPPAAIEYVPALSPFDKHPLTVSAGAGAAIIMIAAIVLITVISCLGGVGNLSPPGRQGERDQTANGTPGSCVIFLACG